MAVAGSTSRTFFVFACSGRVCVFYSTLPTQQRRLDRWDIGTGTQILSRLASQYTISICVFCPHHLRHLSTFKIKSSGKKRERKFFFCSRSVGRLLPFANLQYNKKEWKLGVKNCVEIQRHRLGFPNICRPSSVKFVRPRLQVGEGEMWSFEFPFANMQYNKKEKGNSSEELRRSTETQARFPKHLSTLENEIRQTSL